MLPLNLDTPMVRGFRLLIDSSIFLFLVVEFMYSINGVGIQIFVLLTVCEVP